jgi:hypothetical protein
VILFNIYICENLNQIRDKGDGDDFIKRQFPIINQNVYLSMYVQPRDYVRGTLGLFKEGLFI